MSQLLLQSPRARRITFARCLAFAALFAAGCGEDRSEKQEHLARTFVYEYGTKVAFGLGGDSERFRGPGWSQTEQGFTWTEGGAASLSFRPPKPAQPVTLRMTLGGNVHLPNVPFQPVDVYANGEKIASWQVAEKKECVATIPENLIASRPVLTVDLQIPKAVSPSDLGQSADPRRLGLRCFEMNLSTGATDTIAQRSADQKPTDQHYSYGTTIAFGKGQMAENYKVSGWHEAEKEFVWTNAGPAVLAFNVGPATTPLKLTANLSGPINPSHPFLLTEVYVNKQRIAEWQVGAKADFVATIPAELSSGGTLIVELRPRDAVSPKALGLSADPRVLGVCCYHLQIAPGE